ncbi:MAG: hypothetical protein ACE5E5_07020 [Phycisphaerae bacterium]
MNSHSLPIGELLDALRKMDIEVRFEHLDGKGGGLCRVGKQSVFFVDLDADAATTTKAGLDALLSIPDVERTFLPPSIRAAMANRNQE